MQIITRLFQVWLSSQTTGRGNRERNCTFRTSIHSPFVAVGGEEVRYFTPFLCLAVFPWRLKTPGLKCHRGFLIIPWHIPSYSSLKISGVASRSWALTARIWVSHVRDLLRFHTCNVSHLVIIIEAFMAKCHKSGIIRSFYVKINR